MVEVISRLFEGMRQGDSAMVRQAFTKEAQMYTVIDGANGDAQLRRGSLKKFLEAVGTPHEEVWDEPIWDTDIKIDGNLAQVWTQYAFYFGDKFSHCGVDAFQLVRLAEGWKIFQATDTRKKDGCQIPDHIQSLKKMTTSANENSEKVVSFHTEQY